MKTIVRSFNLLILSAFTLSTFAQQTEFLLNIPTDFNFNGFAEVNMKFTSLIDENATYVGVKGGTAINSMLGLGVTAGGFITENHFQLDPVNGVESNQMSALMGYTGVFVEYFTMAN